MAKVGPHKEPKSDIASEAKILGYKPIMVIVGLLENWSVLVQAEGLQFQDDKLFAHDGSFLLLIYL